MAEYVVARAFRHANTGRVWRSGEAFDGTPEQAAELAGRGFLRQADSGAPGEPERADEAGGSEPGRAPTPDELEAMSKDGLSALCAQAGIEMRAKARKDELVEALKRYYLVLEADAQAGEPEGGGQC